MTLLHVWAVRTKCQDSSTFDKLTSCAHKARGLSRDNSSFFIWFPPLFDQPSSTVDVLFTFLCWCLGRGLSTLLFGRFRWFVFLLDVFFLGFRGLLLEVIWLLGRSFVVFFGFSLICEERVFILVTGRGQTLRIVLRHLNDYTQGYTNPV